ALEVARGLIESKGSRACGVLTGPSGDYLPEGRVSFGAQGQLVRPSDSAHWVALPEREGNRPYQLTPRPARLKRECVSGGSLRGGLRPGHRNPPQGLIAGRLVGQLPQPQNSGIQIRLGQ